MLEAVLSVNGDEIDRLKVVRTQPPVEGVDAYVYRCSKDNQSWYVIHKYSDGAFALVRRAIDAMPGDFHA